MKAMKFVDNVQLNQPKEEETNLDQAASKYHKNYILLKIIQRDS